jgi:hypothetical protein
MCASGIIPKIFHTRTNSLIKIIAKVSSVSCQTNLVLMKFTEENTSSLEMWLCSPMA